MLDPLLQLPAASGRSAAQTSAVLVPSTDSLLGSRSHFVSPRSLAREERVAVCPLRVQPRSESLLGPTLSELSLWRRSLSPSAGCLSSLRWPACVCLATRLASASLWLPPTVVSSVVPPIAHGHGPLRSPRSRATLSMPTAAELSLCRRRSADGWPQRVQPARAIAVRCMLASARLPAQPCYRCAVPLHPASSRWPKPTTAVLADATRGLDACRSGRQSFHGLTLPTAARWLQLRDTSGRSHARVTAGQCSVVTECDAKRTLVTWSSTMHGPAGQRELTR